MIFQALIELYDRLGKEVPPLGFSREAIGFALTIDSDGNLVGKPEDLRSKDEKTVSYRHSVVPYSNKVNVRSSGAATTPNFMVDKSDFIFGMSGKDKKGVHHKSFIQLITDVCGDSQDEGILAVKRFLGRWKPDDSPQLQYWDEMCGPHGKWVGFKLKNRNREFIHERPEVKKLWAGYIASVQYKKGVSFTDGQVHSLQSQYAQFPFGSGASLVSFNIDVYESYGKKRGDNAPISVVDEFKSSTALKYLLEHKNARRIRIGDAATLFWAERSSPMENIFGDILNPDEKSLDDSITTQQIEEFLKAARKGVLPNEMQNDSEVKFYILGFSVNKARLALRFWHICTIGELARRLGEHYKCLAMEKQYEKDISNPGTWHLMKETARETKDISPVLGGALMRAILTGCHYPQNLYLGVLRRINADRRVNYLRASIIKAVLQRNYNYTKEKEIFMSLDANRREPAYLLGRLFAVLEKAQLDALGKVNATIKDRFFSAASATPSSVFPRLLRLSQHHIAKAEYGKISDMRIADILEHMDGFPALLGLPEQGLFAIGYYQQKNNFYNKKEKKGESDEPEIK